MSDWRDGCSVEWALPWPADVGKFRTSASVPIADAALRGLSVRARKVVFGLVGLPGFSSSGRSRFRGARSVRDLEGVTSEELFCERNCGLTTVEEIAAWLAGHGVAVLRTDGT